MCEDMTSCTDADDRTDASYCMCNFYLPKSMIQVNIITHISHSPKSEWAAKIEVSLFQRLFWYIHPLKEQQICR